MWSSPQVSTAEVLASADVPGREHRPTPAAAKKERWPPPMHADGLTSTHPSVPAPCLISLPSNVRLLNGCENTDEEGSSWRLK